MGFLIFARFLFINLKKFLFILIQNFWTSPSLQNVKILSGFRLFAIFQKFSRIPKNLKIFLDVEFSLLFSIGKKCGYKKSGVFLRLIFCAPFQTKIYLLFSWSNLTPWELFNHFGNLEHLKYQKFRKSGQEGFNFLRHCFLSSFFSKTRIVKFNFY